MKIDDDVRITARRFGIDPALIQAVVTAEGDIVKAIQCTFPSVATRDQALDITCRSAVHALSDYIRLRHGGNFVDFWGARWAPVGAANDPHNLNANWATNVKRLWLFSMPINKVDVGPDVPGGGAS